MKHTKLLLLCIFSLVFMTACDDDEPEYPTVPAPGWTVNMAEQYPVSMSAIVLLPDNLATYAAEGDELAAFVGDECRGVGEIVTVNENKIYSILIKGNGSETENIKFKYYSSKNSYMYATAAFLKFEADTRFGSVDEPEVLPLEFAHP